MAKHFFLSCSHQEARWKLTQPRFTTIGMTVNLLGLPPNHLLQFKGREKCRPPPLTQINPLSPLYFSFLPPLDAKPKSPFLPLAHSVSTSFGDFLTKHGSSPNEAPLENSPPVSSLASGPRKGQECRSVSPVRMDFKQAASQQAPVTPKPCFQEPGVKVGAFFHTFFMVGRGR